MILVVRLVSGMSASSIYCPNPLTFKLVPIELAQPPILCFLTPCYEPQFPTSWSSRHYKLSWIAHKSMLSLRDQHFWEVVSRGDQSLLFSSGAVVFTFYKIGSVGSTLFSYMRCSPIATTHGLFDNVVLLQYQGSFFNSDWTFKQFYSGYDVAYYDRRQWRRKRESSRKRTGHSPKSRFI